MNYATDVKIHIQIYVPKNDRQKCNTDVQIDTLSFVPKIARLKSNLYTIN